MKRRAIAGPMLGAVFILFLIQFSYWVLIPVWNQTANGITGAFPSLCMPHSLGCLSGFASNMNNVVNYGYILATIIVVAYIFVYAFVRTPVEQTVEGGVYR